MATDPMSETAFERLTADEDLNRMPPAAAVAPEPGSCVLIGPAGAGKSGFLGALGRAFESERSPAWEWFVPGRRLVHRSEDLSQASTWQTYSFQLGIRSEQPLEMTVLETPDSFFEALAGKEPTELSPAAVEDLVRASRNARCLVLCVPTATPSAGRMDLTRCVDRLLVAGSRRLLRLGGRRWPGLESPWERPPRLELPFDRVLILITGIESLCREVLHRLGKRERHWRSSPPDLHAALEAYRGLDAWAVAELLDSWAMASERILGLDILASSLKPDATMAVCPIGLRGLQRRRTAPRPPSFLDRTDDGAAIDDSVDQQPLAPFGVWPALRFVATGRAEVPVAIADPSRKQAAPGPYSVLVDERDEGST